MTSSSRLLFCCILQMVTVDLQVKVCWKIIDLLNSKVVKFFLIGGQTPSAVVWHLTSLKTHGFITQKPSFLNHMPFIICLVFAHLVLPIRLHHLIHFIIHIHTFSLQIKKSTGELRVMNEILFEKKILKTEEEVKPRRASVLPCVESHILQFYLFESPSPHLIPFCNGKGKNAWGE